MGLANGKNCPPGRTCEEDAVQAAAKLKARFAARVKSDQVGFSRARLAMTGRGGKGNVAVQAARRDRPGEKYLGYVAGIEDPDLSSTILIEIPSYCDPELRNTIEAALKMAANPDRIRFAVCLQDDDPDILEYLGNVPGCRVKHFARADAPGTCAARYECQQLYGGEDFVFHVDPHMRFARYWDVAIIDQWRRCGDPKAILSTRGVDLRKEDLDLPVDSDLFNEYVPAAPGKLAGRMFVEGPGIIRGLYFVEGRWDPRFDYGNCFYDFNPRPGAFVCAHYVFGPGCSDLDVPVDRYMDFTGDELAVSVRYYTHGYNVYHPGAAFVYHLWRRDLVYGADKLAPSGDKVKVEDKMTRKQRQVRRVEKLLGLEDYPDVDLSGFGLGTERSLADFEAYSGMSFRDASIARFCRKGDFGAAHTPFDGSPYDWYPAAAGARGEDTLAWARRLREAAPGYEEKRRAVAAWRNTEGALDAGPFGVTDLHVVREDFDSVVLGWSGPEGRDCSYAVQGAAPDLHFETLAETDGCTASIPRGDCLGFAGFRVAALARDGTKALAAVSGILKYNGGKVSPDPVEMVFMPSYGGRTSIVLRHEGIYFYYCVYDCTAGKSLLLTSEDFILSTDKLQAGHSYMAEGYLARDGGYVLAGCSRKIVYDGIGWRRPGLGGAKPVLSVVMPVRNVERYLPRAVDSILACEMESLELVLVDDGSTDDCPEICAWYAGRYDFISVRHTDRQGPAESRNEGLDHASGQWLAFADSDDMVHPYSYRRLYEAALATGAGIAIMGAVIRHKFGGYEYVLNPFGKDSTDGVLVCGMGEMFAAPGYGRYNRAFSIANLPGLRTEENTLSANGRKWYQIFLWQHKKHLLCARNGIC